MGEIDSGFSATLRNTLYLFLGIILSQGLPGRAHLALLRPAVRVLPGTYNTEDLLFDINLHIHAQHWCFIGHLRGFSLLPAERWSQGGNATSVEGPAVKEGGRFLHLRAYEKFAGRNQSKTAPVGGRRWHQFRNYEKVVGERHQVERFNQLS